MEHFEKYWNILKIHRNIRECSGVGYGKGTGGHGKGMAQFQHISKHIEIFQ